MRMARAFYVKRYNETSSERRNVGGGHIRTVGGNVMLEMIGRHPVPWLHRSGL
jgi:hypothetical protein